MAVLPDYVSGTITLANGSTTVTGTGTMFQAAAFKAGDTLQIQNLTAVIASVNSNTSLTLTAPWTGTSLTNAPYRARYLPDGARVTAQTTTLIQLLGNGNLEAVAGLTSAPDKGIMFTGPGTAGTFDLTEFARTLLAGTSAAAMLSTLGAQASIGYTPANRAGDTFTGVVTAPTLQVRNSSGTVVGVINTGTSGSNGINYFAGTDGHQWGGSGLGNMTWASNTLTVPGIGLFNSTGNNVKLSVTGYGSGRGIGAQLRAGVAGSAAAVQFLNSSGTAVGSIGTTDSATTFNTSSDWRLKPSVEPLVTFELSADDFDELDNTLLRVMSMRPVRHNMIGDLLTFVHGFIAHELQAPAPHAVTGKKDAVEEIGTAVVAGELIPAHIRIETRVIDGETIEVLIEDPERQLPDRIYENVRRGEYENEKSWTKTGERPVYQGVDHSKLVPDLTAALQSLTLMVLKQRDRITALEHRLNGS